MKNHAPSTLARACAVDAQEAELAADAKHGPESALPCEQSRRLFAAIYAAIACAKRNGTPRARIEAALGMGTGVLSDYLCAKPHYQMRLDHIARLMYDPSVLGDAAHRVLVSRLIMGMSRRPLAAVDPAPADALPTECFDVFDAMGALAEEAREAQHPDSPGGISITVMEHIAIGARAEVVMIESAQLIPGREVGDAS
jgi:hypothetical protein